MIYDHIVKVNGEYYQAGMEVPEKFENKNEEVQISTLNQEFKSEPAKRGRPRKS